MISFMGGKHRGFFKKEELKEKFSEEIDKLPGKYVPQGGYPDCGNGLHAQKMLDYGQWYKFNLAQRNAKNYMEVITMFTFALLVLTVVNPMLAVGCGVVNLVCRTGYLVCYSRSPQLRVYFAPFMTINMFVALFSALYSAYSWHSQLPF